MRIPTAAVPGGGALVAVAATAMPVVAYGRQPDAVNLAAGLVLLLAGAELLALAQTRATGLLLVAASTAWFLPDLAVTGTAAGAFLSGTTLAHVVPLVAAVLVAPSVRLSLVLCRSQATGCFIRAHLAPSSLLSVSAGIVPGRLIQ